MKNLKFALYLLLMQGLLTGCCTGLSLTSKQELTDIAPDVATMPLKEQQKAAAEMKGGQCPALNQVANLCLMTLDEARALSK